MVAGFVIALAPHQFFIDFINSHAERLRQRKFDPNTAADIKFYLSVAIVLGGFVRTGQGRLAATDDVVIPGITKR